MNKEYVYKALGGTFKDVDTEKRKVNGILSKFDAKDSDKDIIRFGAFAKSIAERGPGSSHPRIKHFLNHDIYLPIGVFTTLQERKEENDLYYESDIPNHQLGKDFIDMAVGGLITEHSIGFRPIAYKDLEDGGWEFTEVKLWEGSSLTAWGANEWTPLLGVKSQNKEAFLKRLSERKSKLEDFVRNSSASDEMLDLLTIEIKQLQQLVIDVIDTKDTRAVEAPEPLVKEYHAKAAALLNLLKYRV